MAEIINFLEAKQALELRNVRRMYEEERDQPVPRKKALVISALPDEPLPPEYPDFRPFLQRDGLILLSWAWWKDFEGWPHYRINWVKSCGKMKRYADWWYITDDVKNMLREALPDRRGDYEYRLGKIGPLCDYYTADVVFICAPELDIKTRPIFIEKLKQTGVTVNFDFNFTLGYAKGLKFKKQVEEIQSPGSQIKNPHPAVWGGEATV